MEQHYTRRKYFINKGYQGRMVALALLLTIAGCLLFVVMFGAMYADSLRITIIDNDSRTNLTPLLLLKRIILDTWPFFIALLFCVIFFTILLSHRIVGPLYRFERTLEHMLQGYLDYTITLRDKDEGKELAAKINDFNDQLSRTLRTVNNNSRAITNLLSRLDDLELEESRKEELASLCWSIEAHNRKIQQACNSYVITDNGVPK